MRILLAAIFVTLLIGGHQKILAQEPVVETENAPVASITAPLLNGEWSGQWFSCDNGHRGPLHASLCQIDACRYEVRFRGRFCKVIPFFYRTELNVTGVTPDGRVTLSASKRLGPLLGVFAISAWANSNQFVAAYSSKDDRGQFVLTRTR